MRQMIHCFFIAFAANPKAKAMKTSKEIQTLISDKDSEIRAIEAVIKEENREPNEEETTAINSWYGTDDENDPGEAAGLQKQLATAQHRERKQAELKAAARQQLQPELDRHVSSAHQIGDSRRIPAECRSRKPLKAFRGPDAEYEAYVSGLFFAASIFGHEPSRQQLRDMDVMPVQAAMSTSDGSGGEAVPDITERTIITIAEENGVVRRFARPVTMPSEVHYVPLRTAGLTVYYPGQNAAITPSDITTSKVTLTAFEWATITEISNRLSMTSVVSMADEIAMNIGLALALAEDTNGFLGDGTGTYGGISGLDDAINANSVQTAASGNVSFATLDLADFEDTAAKLPRFSGAQPCWFIHSAGYFSSMVRLMNASGGTPGSEVASGYNAMFMGYPVCFTQVLPSAPGVSTNVCFFGDLSQSVYFGSLAGLQISADGGGKYFEKNQIAVKGVQYADITVANQDSSSAGPMVALATPAS